MNPTRLSRISPSVAGSIIDRVRAGTPLRDLAALWGLDERTLGKAVAGDLVAAFMAEGIERRAAALPPAPNKAA